MVIPILNISKYFLFFILANHKHVINKFPQKYVNAKVQTYLL